MIELLAAKQSTPGASASQAETSGGKTSAEPPLRLTGPWYFRNSRRAI